MLLGSVVDGVVRSSVSAQILLNANTSISGCSWTTSRILVYSKYKYSSKSQNIM